MITVLRMYKCISNECISNESFERTKFNKEFHFVITKIFKEFLKISLLSNYAFSCAY